MPSGRESLRLINLQAGAGGRVASCPAGPFLIAAPPVSLAPLGGSVSPPLAKLPVLLACPVWRLDAVRPAYYGAAGPLNVVLWTLGPDLVLHWGY